jgi:hypothetical protein
MPERPRKLRDSGAPPVEQTIERLVEAAPPLSDEAARRLTGLLATRNGKAKP